MIKRDRIEKGQVVVEALIVLILIFGLISGFFVYIYKASIVLWTDYHLNQALHCENSKVLQTTRYLNSGKTPQSRNKTLTDKENRTRPHRKNRNCLAKAKANIQKLVPWNKVSVHRNNSTDEYEVIFKWAENSKIQIKSKTLQSRLDQSKERKQVF